MTGSIPEMVINLRRNNHNSYWERTTVLMKKEGIIEFVCHGGTGGEATVCLELRTRFPGIGGAVITEEGVASALRAEHSPGPKSGLKMFLRHTIIKKLEDYFQRNGKYVYAHIPRPLGSISRDEDKPYEAYMYEWVFGSEGFPWGFTDRDGNKGYIKLHDWGKFVGTFHTAGINMSIDISDSDDADISKNIIHQHPMLMADQTEMNLLWRRIDFGYQSLTIDFQVLERFLHDEKDNLINVLRYWRYEMLLLSKDYLLDREKMNERDKGRLEILIADYRRSTLQHLVSRGVGLHGSTTAYIEGAEGEDKTPL